MRNEPIKLLLLGGKDVASTLEVRQLKCMGLEMVNLHTLIANLDVMETQEIVPTIVELIKQQGADGLIVDLDIYNDRQLLTSLHEVRALIITIGSGQSHDNKVERHIQRPLTRQQYVAKLRRILQECPRTQERLSLPGRVEFRCGDAEYTCGIENLSTGGIQLRTNALLEVGNIYELTLHLANERPMHVQARVLRKSGNLRCYGARFLHLTALQRQLLEAYLNRFSFAAIERIYYG
ncbi:MAG: PilZ domain-containing protein [Pseudomonadota bacterium]|nr:PilZ domain-containing protein [Pseudomonadota bacterium]